MVTEKEKLVMETRVEAELNTVTMKLAEQYHVDPIVLKLAVLDGYQLGVSHTQDLIK